MAEAKGITVSISLDVVAFQKQFRDLAAQNRRLAAAYDSAAAALEKHIAPWYSRAWESIKRAYYKACDPVLPLHESGIGGIVPQLTDEEIIRRCGCNRFADGRGIPQGAYLTPDMAAFYRNSETVEKMRVAVKGAVEKIRNTAADEPVLLTKVRKPSAKKVTSKKK